ncbi:hypothetical protein VTN77DRAFT_2197 [Rasamsonia byssochlamydoides]|uniref:uncharacterized protein n=1 Tax=Rasamsonia byssochlamydoides TaxID=89139 RepID=UPI0037442B70
MSTLQVPDPRSRTRSKSRSRERSRSRDSRARSPSSELSKKAHKKYHDDDNSDSDARRYPSASEQKSRSRSRSKYDRSDSEEDKYRARERAKDRYYHSESDGDVSRRREAAGKSASRYRSESEGDEERKYYRHSPTYASDSDDSSTDSDLSALAYGESGAVPGRQYPDSSRDEKSHGHVRSSSATYHLWDDLDDAPGSHPSYARPERFSYAQPAQFREKRHASYSGAQPPLPAEGAELPGYLPSSQAPMQPPAVFPPTAQPPGAFLPVSAAPDYAHAYASAHSSYANPPQWQYAQPDRNIKYTSKSTKQPYTQSSTNQFVKPYTQSSEPQFVEIAPGSAARPRPHSLSVSSANNLSVGGGRPPASPLLEAYKGTYQSISPMPSPIASPRVYSSRLDEDISDLDGLEGGSGSDGRKRHGHHRSKSRDDSKDRKNLKEKEQEKQQSTEHKSKSYSHNGKGDAEVILISPSTRSKRVSFYNPTNDALALKEALSHHLSVDIRPLIKILPFLSSDEILDLRAEYKNHAKLHGKGINIAKHIKLKLGSTAFGKACYATALGRWESEAYWANYYYQAGTSRRELLIESLIGRTNAEIREIKACFRDPRYGDSLERCMKAELKADKFRTAILLALEERRQPERDTVDVQLVQQDVQDLHHALVSREGGETAMIYIIVLRSDAHLREVLRVYESIYRQNFAKAMINKSRNLVGETLAHILNGVINRPMRDALLLHQAIRESRSGRERSELLISRLVRLHWEPRHLEMVKHEYRKRYKERVEEAIAQEVLTTSGGSEWGEFCIELARSSEVLTRGGR